MVFQDKYNIFSPQSYSKFSKSASNQNRYDDKYIINKHISQDEVEMLPVYVKTNEEPEKESNNSYSRSEIKVKKVVFLNKITILDKFLSW